MGKITSDWLEVIPAYGRDYATAKAAKADWLNGKDWMVAATGQYCSRRDFGPGTRVILRYARLEKTAVVAA